MSLSLLLASTLVPPCNKANPLHSLPNPSPRLPIHVTRMSLSDEKQSQSHYSIDRRNVLLGLGGLYASQGKLALGEPVGPPDLNKCQPATDAITGVNYPCCPKFDITQKPVDFVPPSPNECLRRRKPAHELSPEEIEKFKTAVAKMKALDENDPWSFMQQAQIHCSYCNGSFYQKGYEKDEIPIDVHGNWLFPAWHRMYLYFWERILGKLIDDPTFAIPYWNWDDPNGMKIPPIYLDESSPLYDDERNHDHYDKIVDYRSANVCEPLWFDPLSWGYEPDEVIKIENQQRVLKMFENKQNPEKFMGRRLSAGEKLPKQYGDLETVHNVIHQWVGQSTTPFHHMGNLRVAARDPIFYGHHTNVDRLWAAHTVLRGGKPEFHSNDWLDATFLFFDENRRLVNVKFRDCLTPESMGYTYGPLKLPWLNIRRSYRKLGKTKRRAYSDAMRSEKEKEIALCQSPSVDNEFGDKPRKLDAAIRVLVSRPKTGRKKEEKEDKLEELVIGDIDIIDERFFTRFDVFIAKPGSVDDGIGESAGYFAKLAHPGHKMARKANLSLNITDLIDDIEAESSDKLVVTLVPVKGIVEIGKLQIELVDSDP